jgi:2-hydroxycyclohexanecarboxyl-CoA dehydrogenase
MGTVSSAIAPRAYLRRRARRLAPVRLEGRTALVTGGASGIGAATCRRLAAEGARVAVTDLAVEPARELASELGGEGLELDVSSEVSVREAVAEAEATLGPVELLVNNAGIEGEGGFFATTDPVQWDAVLTIDLRGVMTVTHAVLGGMQERGYGRIVNVASEAGRVGSQLAGAYSAAKAGVIGFTKTIAREGARFGVTCNAVAPGPIATPMLERTGESGELGSRLVQGMVAATAMGRPGTPEEVAAAIAFLASDDASFVTGETLGVSGGLGMM